MRRGWRIKPRRYNCIWNKRLAFVFYMLYNNKEISKQQEGFGIDKLEFEQVISQLGEIAPEGNAAAQAIYAALVDMAWRGEAIVEETGVNREAHALTISLRVDAMSVCEENADQVHDALMTAAALQIRLHEEDTFWVEVSIPSVFSDTDSSGQLVTIVGDKHEESEDVVLPEWLAKAFKAVKEDRDALRFEDLLVNFDQLKRLADVYATAKELAKCMNASFEFTKPDPPRNMHGGVHLKVDGDVILNKENLTSLLKILNIARSLSISSTDGGHIYISFWVNNLYLPKE